MPRSIMTKGNSISHGTQYGNFIRGNKDKLMITYRREPSHDYTMWGVCGVLYQGEMHFFGGRNQRSTGTFIRDRRVKNYFKNDFSRQHFVIETQSSGQLVKMTQKEELEIGFQRAYCSSLEITSEHFPWFKTNIVILCFDKLHQKSCYSFDGELTYIGDSNYHHSRGGLTKYKTNLLAVGGYKANQKTEIMKIDAHKTFSWSIVEPDFKFTRAKCIFGHSLVTVESSDNNEEYVLLIGGHIGRTRILKNVFKFNGTWFHFGEMMKTRAGHTSIYWNGAVYIIGGYSAHSTSKTTKTKTEIWNIRDSPNHFKTTENWPELFDWVLPHLFIVPDSFFPDI